MRTPSKSRQCFAIVLTLLAGSFTFVSSAFATAGSVSVSDAIGVYIDEPYVQGSYIAERDQAGNSSIDSLTDTYNSTGVSSGSNCPSSGTIGTYVFASAQCKIIARNHNNTTYPFGGALTTSATPTTGGNATNQSDSAGMFDSAGTTITLNRNSNYVGFWWSAGSIGNSISFYQDTNLLLTISADNVCDLVKGSGNCTKPSNASAKVTAIDNTTQYTKDNYYGHPLNTSSMDASEPFTYVHVFAQNSLTFNKIKIATTGNGFELDNLTIAVLSGSELTPKTSLVPVGSYGSTYSLTYDSQGGSSVPTQTLVSGGNVSVTSTIPTRSGYTFAGWNTASNGTGTNYATSSTYPASGTVSGNGALYAKWTALTHSITFHDTNSGSGGGSDGGTAPSSQSGSGSGSVSLNANTLSLAGYTFAGWATSNGSTTVAYADLASVSITSNTTLNLYPVWTALTHAITFHDTNSGSGGGSDGGTAPSSQSGSGSGSVSLNANTLSLAGYRFAGWTTSNGSTTVTYADSASVSITSNTTLNLYPVWEQMYYTAYYPIDGFDWNNPNYNSSFANAANAKDISVLLGNKTFPDNYVQNFNNDLTYVFPSNTEATRYVSKYEVYDDCGNRLPDVSMSGNLIDFQTYLNLAGNNSKSVNENLIDCGKTFFASSPGYDVWPDLYLKPVWSTLSSAASNSSSNTSTKVAEPMTGSKGNLAKSKVKNNSLKATAESSNSNLALKSTQVAVLGSNLIQINGALPNQKIRVSISKKSNLNSSSVNQTNINLNSNKAGNTYSQIEIQLNAVKVFNVKSATELKINGVKKGHRIRIKIS